MKIGFLTLISKLHVSKKKRCITNSMSNYPKLCKIQLQHVKIHCEVGRLFICRVGKVYCGHDKLQCKFGKVLRCKSGPTNYRGRIRSQGDVY